MRVVYKYVIFFKKKKKMNFRSKCISSNTPRRRKKSNLTTDYYTLYSYMTNAHTQRDIRESIEPKRIIVVAAGARNNRKQYERQ